MTDKVQKIREEVEIVINRRLNLLNGDYFDLNKEANGFTNEIMDIIGSLQEEPVSIWHDANEKPNIKEKSGIFVITSLNGEYIGSRYYNYNDITITLGNYDKWAYLNDLLNLSNVQKTVKNLEEPVSNDLEKIVEEIVEPTILNAYGAKELARRLRNTICGTSVSEDLEESAKKAAANAFFVSPQWTAVGKELFKAGVEWQKEKDSILPIYLDEYINELSKQFPEVSFAKLSRIAVRVAKWLKDKMMQNAIDARCFGFQGAALFSFRLPADNYLVGSEVKIIVVKED